MFVKEWMSVPAVCVLPDVPVRMALGLMERRKVRRLPVVEGGALVGIVTLSDLLKVVNRSDGVPSGIDLPIERVMTKNPITIKTDDPLDVAARIMIRLRVSGLPVMEEGRVRGVITESDLFRAMAQVMGFVEPHGQVSVRLPEGERSFHGRAEEVTAGGVNRDAG